MKISTRIIVAFLVFCTTASYAGGSDSTAAKKGRKMDFKTQLFSFAPIVMTEHGMGMGLSYEMGLDDKGFVALNLPVTVSVDANGNSPYTIYNRNYWGGRSIPTSTMYYFNPGIKFYPASCFGKVKYSLTPSMVIAYEHRRTDTYTQLYNAEYTTAGPLVLGFMITNSLNMNPTKHFYLGLDLGIGATYLTPKGGPDNYTVISSMNQFAFKLGYRF